MFPGGEKAPPSPNPEDASNFLVASLRRSQRSASTFGYDVWLPKIIEDYIRQTAEVVPQGQVPPQWSEQLSEPFYAAAWDLCRLGILRPGTRYLNAQSHGDGDGYCVTPRGRTWIAEQEVVPFIPTDRSRTADLLASAGARFGPVYRTRATDAATCYAAGAYYACCAMVGAAAESIALAVAVSRLGEAKAEKTYFGKNGRRLLEDAVLIGVPAWLDRDFRGHTGLIALWRDRAAHAHEAVVTEGEAYMALRGLLRFAHLVDENWTKLAAPPAQGVGTSVT
jgi:hypothetical protein